MTKLHTQIKKKYFIGVLIASFLAVMVRSDCTQDPFCTNCPGAGQACQLCTDNSVEAQRFQFLQPNGSCFAGSTTKPYQNITGGNVYRKHLVFSAYELLFC